MAVVAVVVPLVVPFAFDEGPRGFRPPDMIDAAQCRSPSDERRVHVHVQTMVKRNNDDLSAERRKRSTPGGASPLESRTGGVTLPAFFNKEEPKMRDSTILREKKKIFPNDENEAKIQEASFLSLSLSLSLSLRYPSRQSARVLGYECAFVTTKFGRDRARFAGIYVLHGV